MQQNVEQNIINEMTKLINKALGEFGHNMNRRFDETNARIDNVRDELCDFKITMNEFRISMYEFKDDMYKFQKETNRNFQELFTGLKISSNLFQDHEERIVTLETAR